MSEDQHESKSGQTFYVHAVLFPGPQGYPGHSCVVVTNQPYEFSENSVTEVWAYPMNMNTQRSAWDRYCIENHVYTEKSKHQLKPRAVCINTINEKDLEQVRGDIDQLYGTYTFPWASSGHPIQTFDGHIFNPLNNCLSATKKLLKMLCPEDTQAIGKYGLIFPNQFVDAMYHHVQQKNVADPRLVLPNERGFPIGESKTSDSSCQARWDLAQFMYDDRLSRQRNSYIVAAAVTIFPTTLSINAASSFSDMSSLAIYDVAAFLTITLCLTAYAAYKKNNNPYKDVTPRYASLETDVVSQSTPLLMH